MNDEEMRCESHNFTPKPELPDTQLRRSPMQPQQMYGRLMRPDGGMVPYLPPAKTTIHPKKMGIFTEASESAATALRRLKEVMDTLTAKIAKRRKQLKREAQREARRARRKRK